MSDPYEIRLSDALKDAWAIFTKAPEVFVALAFGIFAACMVLTHLPLVGPLISLLLAALGPASFFVAAEEGSRRGKITFESLKAILPMAPQLLMLFVVKWILIGAGTLLFILPGIYLAVIFVYAELFVVLEGRNFLEALRLSKDLASRSFLSTFGLCFFLAMVAGAGALLVLIGLLLTVPMALLVLYCVFKRASLHVAGPA